MKLLFILLGLLVVCSAHSATRLDAENEGEAVGIFFAYVKEIDVVYFMCDRKVPSSTEVLSNAVSNWLVKNEVILTNLQEALDKTPDAEREELFGLAKIVTDNIIINFNKQDDLQKVETCNALAERLEADTFQQEYPLAYEYLQ